MLTKQEKEYLAELLKKELKHFNQEGKTAMDSAPGFLKAEHEYKHFLENLLKKIK